MLRRIVLGVLASSLVILATVVQAGAQVEPTMPAGAPTGGAAQGQAAPGDEGAAAPVAVLTVSRTHHPGDLVWSAPCFGCRVILDPCEFMAICQQLPGGVLFPPALHWTTLRPNTPQFFPAGPYICLPAFGRNVPACAEAGLAGFAGPGGPGGTQVGPGPGGSPVSPGPAGGQVSPGPGGSQTTAPGGQTSSPPGATPGGTAPTGPR
jgi:hypothetical protein